MEAKTGGRGHGFTVLLLTQSQGVELPTPIRLAYLQVHGHDEYSFYELWNRPVWEELAGHNDGAYQALLSGFADGTISMRRLRRAPSTKMVAIVYDMTTAVVTDVGEGSETVGLFILPKRLRISGPERPNPTSTLGEERMLHPHPDITLTVKDRIITEPPPVPPPPVSREEGPIRTYVIRVDGEARARVGEGMLDKLPDTIRDLKLQPGQTISITG